jgi:hypothetical protein
MLAALERRRVVGGLNKGNDEGFDGIEKLRWSASRVGFEETAPTWSSSAARVGGSGVLAPFMLMWEVGGVVTSEGRRREFIAGRLTHRFST